MLDLAAVAAAFPELTHLAALGAPSGQKDVLRAQLGSETVVLKLIKKNPADESRTEREIAAVGKLSCSYVPRVFQQGHRVIGHEDRLYIIEQMIDGLTYREILSRSPIQPLSEVLGTMETLLLACKSFEAANLVHRDIKPENLIVDRWGKLWVIDFGLVRFLDEISLTPTGLGGLFTPGYGAPEQMRNLKSEIDIRADLFSIGVLAYEALNGSNPYRVGKRDLLEVINHVLMRDLPRLAHPGDPNGRLADFISAMTSRYPGRRPKDASEALDWFADVRVNLTSIP